MALSTFAFYWLEEWTTCSPKIQDSGSSSLVSAIHNLSCTFIQQLFCSTRNIDQKLILIPRSRF